MDSKALKNKDILEGPLLGSVISFTSPLVLIYMLQVFYRAADMLVVNLSHRSGAVGAIGTCSPMISLVTFAFINFSIGGDVLIARNVGANDRKATEKAAHTTFLAGIIFGLAGGIIGVAFATPVLRLLGADGAILEMASTYARIVFAGIPFNSLTSYQMALFRAKGDTKTPFSVMATAGVLHIILALFFVVVLHSDVAGVAFATLLSNLFSAVWLYIKLRREDSWVKLVPSKMHLDKASFKEIVRIGIPAGLQSIFLWGANMFVSSAILTMNDIVCPGGTFVVDGDAAAYTIEDFAYVISDTLFQTATTFTGQHLGAGKIRRIRKVRRICTLCGVVAIGVFGGLIFLARKPLLGLLLTDAEAYPYGVTRLAFMLPTFLICCTMDIGSGILCGCGKSAVSSVNSLLLGCVGRILWILLIFNPNPSLFNLYIGFPITWGLTSVLHFICSEKILGKLQKQQDALAES